MRKKRLIFYCITLVLICQVCSPVLAISGEQRDAIYDHCATIQEGLKSVQRTDARARVYLGSYYEKVLTKFITQLNLRLVENNISDAGLIENQAATAAAREKFNEDFVEYQKGLEGLIATDCKAEPERFYEELLVVREKRAAVKNDAAKVKKRILEHVSLVRKMLEKIGSGSSEGASENSGAEALEEGI